MAVCSQCGKEKGRDAFSNAQKQVQRDGASSALVQTAVKLKKVDNNLGEQTLQTTM